MQKKTKIINLMTDFNCISKSFDVSLVICQLFFSDERSDDNIKLTYICDQHPGLRTSEHAASENMLKQTRKVN